VCGFLSVDVVFSGEVPAETVAQGPNMVIQELSKSFWQPNARCCIEQCPTRQRNGTLVEAQAYSIPSGVGSMKLLSSDRVSGRGWGIIINQATKACEVFWDGFFILVHSCPF
jgi:hypothetical protein